MRSMHLSMVKEIPTQPSIELESLRRFVREHVIPGASDREDTRAFPVEVYRQLHQMGWLQPWIPEELGGSPVSTTDLAWISREIAYGSAGVFLSFLANFYANCMIFRYGSPPLKTHLRDELSKGLSLSGFGWTEADSGSDVFRLKTTATRAEGGYLLTGSKCFVTNANHADRFVVVAKVETPDRRKPLTLFHVPRDAEGVSVGKPLRKLGQFDSNTAELSLINVFVPASHRIGDEGQAPSVCVHNLQRSRTLVAAASVGVCQRAGDIVREHLGTRVLYGKPLLALPMIHNFLAKLYAEAHAAWLMTCSSAATWDAGVNSCRESSMAKLIAADTAVRFTNETLELFGGYGYIRDYEIERLYRDVKFLEIIEGPSFVQQVIISKELFPEIGAQQAANPTFLRKAG